MTIRTCLSGFPVTRRALAWALGSLLFASGAPVFAAAGDGSLSDPNIQFVGRWDKSNGWFYQTTWGGTYLTTKFTGSHIKVRLNKPVKFNYIIDGQLATNGSSSSDVDLWASSGGTHTLQVASDWDTDQMQFLGLALDPGQTTIAPDQRPLIEFIGDSITAGRAANPNGWENTAQYDYAWLTGEKLGADHTQIAVSGIPLVSSGNYYPEGPYIGMDSLYFRALAAYNLCWDAVCGKDPLWDFSRYTPKLVVINLGTNDWNLGVTDDQFQGAYTTFLNNVRAKYPNAEIFVLQTFNAYKVQQTQNAVNARINAGDNKLHYVDTTNWVQHPADFADGFHPNTAGHQKIAGLLAPILQPYLTSASTTTAVNDTLFLYDQAGNWPYGSQAGAYQGDNHWSNNANAYYQLPFTGTQVNVYGARAPNHGIAAVSIDGGPETTVDAYSATRADNTLLWSSPVLNAGQHTLKVRVTGAKNASAWGNYINADRVDVVNGEPNLLSNPGFENGLNNWGAWPAGSWQYVDTTSPHSGTYHLTQRNANGAYGATYTQLSGLSNGVYIAKAWVRGSGGQQMYVKDLSGSTQKNFTIPASNGYTQVVIRDINITSGNAEIGFWTSADSLGQAWLNVDDVTFYKQQ